MTDTQVEAANIVAAWLAALSTGTDIKTVDTVVLRKRIAAALDASRKDYEEVLDDHRRLVRKLDVMMNGEHAAKQASLCDIVASFPKWLDARERAGIDEGKLWSFIRDVLGQGGAIWQDYQAGRYSGYEDYSARLDEAAREWADSFLARCLRQGGV